LKIRQSGFVYNEMIQLLNCPNCNTPLDYDGAQTVVKCAYCGALVAVALISSAVPTPDPQIPDPSLTEVAVLMRAGKRVRVTVLYREITGAGLKEAQQALD
jgi:LSD1 subclass zinc finger protein